MFKLNCLIDLVYMINAMVSPSGESCRGGGYNDDDEPTLEMEEVSSLRPECMAPRIWNLNLIPRPAVNGHIDNISAHRPV